jgi:adenylate cyclase
MTRGSGGARPGPRAAALTAALRRRSRTAPSKRAAFDRLVEARLVRKRAVVFTDTADFTVRTARDGILHFLMVFERAVDEARPAISRAGGEVVKVEGDSLLLRFDDVGAACLGVDVVEACLSRVNAGRPRKERLAFSYGVGFGDVLDLEGDMFGLEVNLASKLGEDLARPGEILLTPAAVAALDDDALRRRLTPYGRARFMKRAIAVTRLLPLARSKRRGG